MRAALLAVLLAAPAAAAEVSWSVAADTAAVLGEEARVTYRPATPPGARLEPDALASATTSFAVVKAEARPDGTWLWTVLPLDLGRPRFVARWKLDGAQTDAPPVEFAVSPPQLPKDAQISDIKGPAAARRALWPWLLALLALAGAAAYVVWLRRRLRETAALPAPAGPPLPPETEAENALAALEASGMWGRGQHVPFYLRLTDILRRYLEARYGEPATAMTSVEVARLLKSRDPDLRAAATAREVLQRADLVKFARISPGAEEGPRDVGLVRALIRATTPAEIAAQSAPAATAAGEAR